jgi:hypothetical protein
MRHWSAYLESVTTKREADERDLADKDPVDVLRRMLAISREDAEKVREDAAKKMTDSATQKDV